MVSLGRNSFQVFRAITGIRFGSCLYLEKKTCIFGGLGSVQKQCLKYHYGCGDSRPSVISPKKTVSPREFSKFSKAVDHQKGTVDTGQLDITDVTTLVTEILTDCAQNDIMVQSLNRLAVTDLVEDLLLKGWSPTLTRNMLVSSPNLLKRSKTQMSKLVDLFLVYGFTNNQTALILKSGVATSMKTNRLKEGFDAFRKIGMRDQKLPRILSNFPELLTQDPSALTHRVTLLKELFKTDDIVPLIVGSPNIVFEDWSNILKLFRYVFFDMGIKQRQMVTSKLFSYSLNFVRTRHIFLVRAGFHVRPRKEDDPVRNTNPRLSDILDTSDAHFAKMFGHMSLKDYKAFAAMMEREFDKEHQTGNDSSNEDE
ncbi:transcription termination factor 4, mitochondrial-like [Liolophura sinensis]|uniref:transcription termination factor 4, mitochondrial-like n=1 Tax=Liolophura sinensis TaxID=3198878 RepID=UPI0031593D60